MKTYLTLFVTLIISAALFGQSRSIRFDNYTNEDGLAQSSVNAIIQDNQGYIWLGTQEGLHKFDGYSFEIFKHDPEDINSLSNSYIKNIAQDNNGIFWVGTESGGVNLFDPKTEKFKRFKEHDILARGQIKALAIDKENNVWIGSSQKGLIKYQAKDSTVVEYGHEQGIGATTINKIIINKRGDILVGSQGKGLFILQKNHKTFDNFQVDKKDKGSIPGNLVNDIFQDNQNRTWIATDKGLSQFNGN